MTLPYELNDWQKDLLDLHTKFEGEVHYFSKSLFSFDATLLDRFRGISYSRDVDVPVSRELRRARAYFLRSFYSVLGREYDPEPKPVSTYTKQTPPYIGIGHRCGKSILSATLFGLTRPIDEGCELQYPRSLKAIVQKRELQHGH